MCIIFLSLCFLLRWHLVVAGAVVDARCVVWSPGVIHSVHRLGVFIIVTIFVTIIHNVICVYILKQVTRGRLRLIERFRTVPTESVKLCCLELDAWMLLSPHRCSFFCRGYGSREGVLRHFAASAQPPALLWTGATHPRGLVMTHDFFGNGVFLFARCAVLYTLYFRDTQ